jgi:enoyl-CoA hydratase
MDKEIILYEKKENIAIITLNRPEALNALSSEVNLKLAELFEKADADAEVRVVILTGAGEKAFIAGADIKEMVNLNAVEGRAFALRAKKVVDKIWNMKKPVIAAINGFCMGGGLEFSMACDLRIASENARFGLPEITLGIMPGSAGTQRLPRLIGMTKAKELCFTGDAIKAQEALALGLVNYVFPAASLMQEAMALGKKIAERSATSLMLIKSAMNNGMNMDIESATMFEIDCFGLCFSTEEKKQGMNAFINKKK